MNHMKRDEAFLRLNNVPTFYAVVYHLDCALREQSSWKKLAEQERLLSCYSCQLLHDTL
jgi:hypothetical protein